MAMATANQWLIWEPLNINRSKIKIVLQVLGLLCDARQIDTAHMLPIIISVP